MYLYNLQIFPYYVQKSHFFTTLRNFYLFICIVFWGEMSLFVPFLEVYAETYVNLSSSKIVWHCILCIGDVGNPIVGIDILDS